ncbi:molybdenum cofactor biosynthesis protein MoaA [Arthrobacter sp. Leaf337]|uniref:molybdopterin molybdotransferase MoeA n=1 Tax=Arthrobacter sp. Leaf337 TaxID=1736342 RepID=UPI0006F82312|nr:gephyrin-like molybdotransferase Glp [Arthrobacter sp. Leaf337]KQR80651.1 molybdenum cofactor biosynthesis protein MoaA [Arthrobacter sp. Leaf337]
MHSTDDRHQARTVEAHRDAVRDLLADLPGPGRTEELPLLAALGRGLAADIPAPVDLPPFANSQMDGFAVRSRDVADGGVTLTVVAPIPAGATAAALEPGTAAPIMTGAMIPLGADAVVPIEMAVPDSFPDPGTAATVRLPATEPGTYVRNAGSDIRSGELALAGGTFLGPGQLGLLAALGITRVSVHRKLKVLLATTGDEVVEPGSPLAPGKIYDANGTLLEAAMGQAGLDVLRAAISTDSPEELTAMLREQAPQVDLIVTTGGVSKGAYEVVRQATAEQDVQFLHVAMQPGGPQGIGRFDGVPFIGFPGNPVSCLVSFEMFLRPVLSSLFGAPAPRPAVRARLAEPVESPAGKHQVRRGTLLPDGTVRLEGGAGSHLVHALASSNALIHVPVGTSALAEGAEVEVWTL